MRAVLHPRPPGTPWLRPAGTAGGPAAFTLIEVLLAVAVFAFVLAAMHGVFYGALRLRNKTTAEVEKTVPLQQALAIIKRDLAGLVLPGGTLAGALQSTPTNSVNLRGRVSGPEFCTATGVLYDTLPWGEVQKVTYYLAPPTNRVAGLDLYRSVTRNLLPTTQVEDPEDQWLMGGVERIEFWFHDGYQWRTEWDSTEETTPLPRGMKAEIELTPEEDQPYEPLVLAVVVPLLLQASSSATNQTTDATADAGGTR